MSKSSVNKSETGIQPIHCARFPLIKSLFGTASSLKAALIDRDFFRTKLSAAKILYRAVCVVNSQFELNIAEARSIPSDQNARGRPIRSRLQ
jgi:hypothetical protein